jgi:hypothetical protein
MRSVNIGSFHDHDTCHHVNHPNPTATQYLTWNGQRWEISTQAPTWNEKQRKMLTRQVSNSLDLLTPGNFWLSQLTWFIGDNMRALNRLTCT